MAVTSGPCGGIGAHAFPVFAEIVGRHVNLDLTGARPGSRLRDDLGFDSLAMAEVLILLAGHGIRLPDELVLELHTLGDLHHYAQALTGAPDPAPAGAPLGGGR